MNISPELALINALERFFNEFHKSIENPYSTLATSIPPELMKAHNEVLKCAKEADHVAS